MNSKDKWWIHFIHSFFRNHQSSRSLGTTVFSAI